MRWSSPVEWKASDKMSKLHWIGAFRHQHLCDVTTHMGVLVNPINPVLVTDCRVLDISASRLVQRIGPYVNQTDRGEIECPVISYFADSETTPGLQAAPARKIELFE